MRYLIDTHVLIWYINGDKTLPVKYIDAMQDPQNTLYVSMATMWEITIKISKEKLDLKKNIKEIKEYIYSKDFEVINISFDNMIILSALDHHHGDPFDRMLIAQAITENLTIISADRHFSAYPVEVIW